MNTTQRLTVRSENGALHVVAIWKGLAQYTDKIGAISARVDTKRRAEYLTIDVIDVCESQLYRIAETLSQSPFSMTAIVEPCRHDRRNAGYVPAAPA